MELLKNLEGMSADEQMTAVVELQKAAMKQLEEQKQVSIGKSAEMVIQGLKKIKSDFEAKFDSLNYDIQAKVANLKDGEQGIQGPKGDQGDRGLDGANGRDGRDGKDGQDGLDGVDGVGVRDAKIDFDGSLVISFTDGREINCGEVVSVDVAKQIQKVTHNIQTGAGGDSQTVLDAIAAIQATIATYGTMATQNKTSVDIEGGTIDNTTIGATTPSTGVFTTLTATGQTSLGGVAGSESIRVLTPIAAAGLRLQVGVPGSTVVRLGPAGASVADFRILAPTFTNFYTGSSSDGLTDGALQARIAHTASAVNYVQVTGAATGGQPTISAQGSDATVDLTVNTKSTGVMRLQTGGANVFRLRPASSAVNYFDVYQSATTKTPYIQSVGSDTNVPFTILTQGTGAIDLAAGSSGVNISNGGTVTALTFTASGNAYTSFPSIAITAPTTAGGVQATATLNRLFQNIATVAGGGTGYTVGNTLTVVGGTPAGSAATLTVSSVSGGVITAVASANFAQYTALPTNPVSVTGGTGSGATLNLQWSVLTGTGSYTITNAGSGYVEQPTVTFSGGGGSGAAAYASVGATATIKGLYGGGSQIPLQFAGPAGNILQLMESGTASPLVPLVIKSGGSSTQMYPNGTNIPLQFSSSGTGGLNFYTGTLANEQLRIANTASAVNYVQVTGAATGSSPSISAQGSDTNLNLNLQVKGTGAVSLAQNRTNYISAFGAGTGASPSFLSQGGDTNIDLTLTPKGTGNVRFGTYTANMALTVQGYIEIKDSGGTVRKLAVIA